MKCSNERNSIGVEVVSKDEVMGQSFLISHATGLMSFRDIRHALSNIDNGLSFCFTSNTIRIPPLSLEEEKIEIVDIKTLGISGEKVSGSGCFGVVFQAFLPGIDRPVAIKRIVQERKYKVFSIFTAFRKLFLNIVL